MPTYDYECQACGHRFEYFSRLHDTAARACPKCGKKKAKRMIGAGAGFIFKGSGFYVTDSRPSSGGNGHSAKPHSKSEPKSDAKSASATSESRPAPKGSEAHPSGQAPKGGEASSSGPKKKSE
jgi:putative FmdB family regulatory protein